VAGNVEWTFTATYGVRVTSPNIGALIQLAIDREGFVDGAYVGIILRAKTPTTNNFCYGRGFTDSGVAQAARLKVYYH